tara:strand:+ start:1622 stop:2842 length:1221 start_codon:yes stop_codon:yes gene_type:complete
MKITKCNNCKSKNLKKIFSLGKLSFSGRFGRNFKENIPADHINIITCNDCRLVQLDRSFNPRYLYGKGYGYRTGINKTMTNHVYKTVKKISKISNLKKKECVLDIASNDGTLLNFYLKNTITVGIDPLVNKYKKFYKKINFKISNFFNKSDINKLNIKKKFKIITALSVFYDLRDPNKFIQHVRELLDQNGIFVLEHADLYSIVKNNVFDTICHEHLCYFSSRVIIEMMKKNRLRVFKHEFNDINGGSSRYYICHKDSKYKDTKSLKKIILKEKKSKIAQNVTLKKFFSKIQEENRKLINLVNNIKKNNKSIHGYGASTKGNIMLQFCKIGKKHIDFIADRNPLKYGLYTPGTKIKIVSEDNSRKIKPDYYLVLPWHFKKEILIRERKIRNKGVKFIFPLPKLNVV